ncbi:Dihydrolipoamide dehydrogenase of 2-oxoglutarate dehydrogenase [hydrothermal vent metagenome]|uniref:Dihydrolipoamide dehydrogenase of 2-oxoglutarate dehydrogenase n=1 Tax=hydrothermal vent metagenome TaxID=652676 RepID=A0A3B1AX68_9ZZZZ
MSNEKFDLIVIGGGPGGYVAAIRAAQLGMKVACVDKRGALGGTCLNVGCIPSKALLQSSHHYETASKKLAAHGIQAESVTLDLTTMMQRKDKVVLDLTKGIEYLFKKNKVAYIKGAGVISSPNLVKVTPQDGGDELNLNTNNILIATGSSVAPLPGVEIDEERILSSTGALSLEKVPARLVVVGGGVIGLELGSVWRRLGAEVTVVEFMDTLLPGMDQDIRKQMQRSMKKQGMILKLSTKVVSAEKSNGGVQLSIESLKNGNSETLEAEFVLVATGRRPYTQGLGLAEAGVEIDERGFIKVDAKLQTNVADIYAIGDVIGGAMLAHKAEEEGVTVAENLAGRSGHVNYQAIPGVVYTLPEAASVGRTEESLKQEGIPCNVGKFPFSANSRARCNGDSEGFVKIIAHAKTDLVLGVHIIGPNAGDLIAEAVLAMEFGASSEDIARTCHAHPGLGEAVKEAALDVDNRAIHI